MWVELDAIRVEQDEDEAGFAVDDEWTVDAIWVELDTV